MSQVYEPKEGAVAILERTLAAHRQQLAAVKSSAQEEQPGGIKSSGSTEPSDIRGSGHDRGGVTKERSPRAEELYRCFSDPAYRW